MKESILSEKSESEMKESLMGIASTLAIANGYSEIDGALSLQLVVMVGDSKVAEIAGTTLPIQPH